MFPLGAIHKGRPRKGVGGSLGKAGQNRTRYLGEGGWFVRNRMSESAKNICRGKNIAVKMGRFSGKC